MASNFLPEAFGLDVVPLGLAVCEEPGTVIVDVVVGVMDGALELPLPLPDVLERLRDPVALGTTTDGMGLCKKVHDRPVEDWEKLTPA